MENPVLSQWKTVDLKWSPSQAPLSVDKVMYYTRESQDEQNMIARMWVLCAMEMEEKFKEATCIKSHFQKYRDFILAENKRFLLPKYPQVPDAAKLASLSSFERQKEMNKLREKVKDTFLWPVIEGPWRVYDNVVDIVEGRTKLVKILLKDGLLEKFYDWANGLSEIRPMFKLMGEANPKLRILEVGAGTGGTTARILDGLKGKNGELLYSKYVFTDISPLFFEAGKKRFADYENFEYRALDITKDPRLQGLEAGEYDLVIASNVLHATPCLVETLKNCRILLKENGVLFNQELSPPGKYVDFMVGMLPGWWLGAADGRGDSPTVPPKVWDQRLSQAGFEGLHAVGLDAEPPFYYNANMVARAAPFELPQLPLNRYENAHVMEPKGRGDGRPTAEQILKDQDLDPKEWKDRVILITGGTAGLGAESVRVLHKTGAKIYITGRDVTKGEKLAAEVQAENPQSPQVEVIKMDHISLQSVREGCAEFLKRSGGKLNVLMANAGIVISTSPKTDDGFEGVFGINYLGVFLTVQQLSQALMDSTTPEFKSRLVVVSSAGHRAGNINPDDYNTAGPDGYNHSKAYAASKTGTILLANEFDRRFKAKGVRALSLNPGVIMGTEISRGLPGTSESRRAMYYKMEPLLAKYEKNVEQGAATQVWATIAKELENHGMLYLDDVQVAKEAKFEGQMCRPGWKPYIWDEEMAKRVWKDSLDMCGLPKE